MASTQQTTQTSNDTLCWTCDEKIATHREWRDGLGEYEYTCPECHRNEYPEKYTTEITENNITYFKDDNNDIYDDMGYVIGTWNENNKKIEFD